MKKQILFSSLAVAFLALSFAFTNALTSYKVDTKKSALGWYGSKITGSSHTGGITLKEGTILTEDGKLKGGSFIVDMASITCTDITDPSSNKKLVGHLKSDDFFNTEKFPEAKFVIKSFVDNTKTEKNHYQLNGELTIKGITNEVSFPATIAISEESVTANAKISFDRSKYDVRYGSNSFFDNLGDKAISNEIIIDVTLIATK